MPHLASCTDKGELGIDEAGNDFCTNCGGIIKTHEDQAIIQAKFLSNSKSIATIAKEAIYRDLLVKRLDKRLLKKDLDKLLAFYYKKASLEKIEASKIFPHLFVYIDILNYDIKVKS